MQAKLRTAVAVCLCWVVAAPPKAAECGETASSMIRQTIESRRADKSPAVNTRDIIAAGSPDEILAATKPFGTDPSAAVRREALGIDWVLADQKRIPEVRREVAARLSAACLDPKNRAYCGSYAEWLLGFSADEFTESAKDSIRKMIAEDNPPFDLVVLAGVAGLQDQMPRLRKLLIDEEQFRADEKAGNASELLCRTTGWGARLALARLGSREDIARCIEIAKSEPDDVYYVRAVHEGLAYIRQPEVIPVFRLFLDSKRTVESTIAGAPPSEARFWTLDMLAHLVKGFPVKTSSKYLGFTSMSEADIEKAKTWLDSQTSFEFQDISSYYPRL